MRKLWFEPCLFESYNCGVFQYLDSGVIPWEASKLCSASRLCSSWREQLLETREEVELILPLEAPAPNPRFQRVGW